MTTITFQNGKSADFEGTPSPEDIDFVAKQMGIQPEGAPTTEPVPESSGMMNPFFKANSNGNPLIEGAKTLGNIIPSAINTGVAVVKTPIEGFANIGKISGVASDLFKMAKDNPLEVAKDIGTSTYETVVPSAARDILSGIWDLGKAGYYKMTNNPQKVSDALDHASSKAGTAATAITEDPVGQILPFLLIGREAAYKHSPEAGMAFDSSITKVAKPVIEKAKPIVNAVGNIAGAPKTVGKFAVSRATGLDPETMSEISKNPSQFSRKAQSTVDRPSVASEIKSALDLREENLSETGQAYKPVRESTRPIIVDHNFLKNEIEQSTGTKIQEQTSPAPKQTPLKKGELPTIQMNPEPVTTTKSKPGTINATGSSLIRDPKDVRALQNFYNTWEPYFRKGEMTANEFLNMRTDLAKLSRFDREISKSGDLENISKQIRANTNNAYRKQIRGLEDIDADFHSQKTELDALRKGILDRDGNLTDASINKIANSANKGRTVFADQLEQISPGILNRVKVLKAIEDIQNTGGHKVGTYSRAMLGGGGIVAGVMTGNLGIIAASIGEMALSNPEFAVPMLRAYGWNKGLVNAVIDKLKGRASMLNEAPQGAPSLGAFAPEAFKSVADKVKDMPMGLSIEDVSKKR